MQWKITSSRVANVAAVAAIAVVATGLVMSFVSTGGQAQQDELSDKLDRILARLADLETNAIGPSEPISMFCVQGRGVIPALQYLNPWEILIKGKAGVGNQEALVADVEQVVKARLKMRTVVGADFQVFYRYCWPAASQATSFENVPDDFQELADNLGLGSQQLETLAGEVLNDDLEMNLFDMTTGQGVVAAMAPHMPLMETTREQILGGPDLLGDFSVDMTEICSNLDSEFPEIVADQFEPICEALTDWNDSAWGELPEDLSELSAAVDYVKVAVDAMSQPLEDVVQEEVDIEQEAIEIEREEIEIEKEENIIMRAVCGIFGC